MKVNGFAPRLRPEAHSATVVARRRRAASPWRGGARHSMLYAGFRGERAMPYFTSGQSQLYYEDIGEGPAVVLAHGVGGNHASWFNQVPTLSKRYRTIVIDHRAFGNSDDVEG